jgi:hypothetical protein
MDHCEVLISIYAISIFPDATHSMMMLLLVDVSEMLLYPLTPWISIMALDFALTLLGMI